MRDALSDLVVEYVDNVLDLCDKDVEGVDVGCEDVTDPDPDGDGDQERKESEVLKDVDNVRPLDETVFVIDTLKEWVAEMEGVRDHTESLLVNDIVRGVIVTFVNEYELEADAETDAENEEVLLRVTEPDVNVGVSTTVAVGVGAVLLERVKDPDNEFEGVVESLDEADEEECVGERLDSLIVGNAQHPFDLAKHIEGRPLTTDTCDCSAAGKSVLAMRTPRANQLHSE